MALSKEDIELLHNAGKMPDWIYYQQNGKSASENYRAQKMKLKEQIQAAQNAVKAQQAAEESAADQVKKVLETELEKALEKILHGKS